MEACSLGIRSRGDILRYCLLGADICIKGNISRSEILLGDKGLKAIMDRIHLSENRKEEMKRILRVTWVLLSVLLWGVLCPSALFITGVVCFTENCGNDMFPYWFVIVGGLITSLGLCFIVWCVVPVCGYYIFSCIQDAHIPEYSPKNWVTV